MLRCVLLRSFAACCVTFCLCFPYLLFFFCFSLVPSARARSWRRLPDPCAPRELRRRPDTHACLGTGLGTQHATRDPTLPAATSRVGRPAPPITGVIARFARRTRAARPAHPPAWAGAQPRRFNLGAAGGPGVPHRRRDIGTAPQGPPAAARAQPHGASTWVQPGVGAGGTDAGASAPHARVPRPHPGRSHGASTRQMTGRSHRRSTWPEPGRSHQRFTRPRPGRRREGGSHRQERARDRVASPRPLASRAGEGSPGDLCPGPLANRGGEGNRGASPPFWAGRRVARGRRPAKPLASRAGEGEPGSLTSFLGGAARAPVRAACHGLPWPARRSGSAQALHRHVPRQPHPARAMLERGRRRRGATRTHHGLSVGCPVGRRPG